MLLIMYGLLASLWFKKDCLRTNLPRFQSSRLEKLLISRLPGAKPSRDFFPRFQRLQDFRAMIGSLRIGTCSDWLDEMTLLLLCSFHWITAVLNFSPLHCNDNQKCM